MAGIPLQEEWMLAFGTEDGYHVRTILDQEPRLLTVKYRGCTVLHLAMRKNWYGLVSKIFEKFKHLYKEKSPTQGAWSSRPESATPDPNQDTNVLQSSHTADPQATTGYSQSQEGSAPQASPSSSEVTVPNHDINVLQSSHTADPPATTRNSQSQEGCSRSIFLKLGG